MPELRRGPIADRWSIIAPERAKRPSDFCTDQEIIHEDQDNCPFCPGNEQMTPPEIYRIGGGEDRWKVRVVPNKFPALDIESKPETNKIEDLFDCMSGVGAHEVVIDSPDHCKEIADLPTAQTKSIIDTYAKRLEALIKQHTYRYVLLFKNHGKKAGASLSHPHTQMIATPVVPGEVRERLESAKAYYDTNGSCLFCDILDKEIHAKKRIVDQENGFVVWTPYASRFPFETFIFPKAHSHDFTEMTERQKWGLAYTLQRTFTRYKKLLGDQPYNFMLQTSPNTVPRPGKPSYWNTLEQDYHWHIEVIPRLTKVAGFEWGTGFYINPVAPENAARYLREIDISKTTTTH